MVLMTHHYSGPKFGFPRGDARVDFTDLFAFPKPEEDSKSIIIMNTHSSNSLNPEKPFEIESHDDMLKKFPFLGAPHVSRTFSAISPQSNGGM